MYLSWLSVLFGAIVAANLPYFRHVRARGLNQSNDVFNEALSILRLLDQSRSQSSSGLSIRSLSETLELTEDQIDKTLASLQDLGWVAQAQVRKREVWVLVCNPSTTSINPLIKRLLVNRSPLKLEENPALKQALLLYLKDNQDSILADVLLQNDKSDTLTVQSNKSSTKETHHVAGQ